MKPGACSIPEGPHNALNRKGSGGFGLKHLADDVLERIERDYRGGCVKSFDTLPRGELEIREREISRLGKIDLMGRQST